VREDGVIALNSAFGIILEEICLREEGLKW
jgi:hypothetical protein